MRNCLLVRLYKWNRRLKSDLERERALFSQMNEHLDEAMELIAKQQAELVETKALVDGFAQLIETQVKPLAREVLEYTKQEQWRRGEQFAFRSDEQ